MRLSDRLNTIASYIKKGESIADIGTDHALLPIFLWKKGICKKIIISDINEGPLEKARANINRLCPDMDVDIRKGSGIETLLNNEVDTVIIAGMGGLLIIDILGYDINKARSFGRYILQPRNASDKLRVWLYKNNFDIIDERLVQEGKF
ncbi:MAG: SAM-dependent methyltransferase, partial [Firmicutes bacterium]|nr:SAM-dependent methyltransferase [Bacillota bacterium]